MGTWGPGLYANDTASDLKSTIAAVVRLPIAAPELVEMLVARDRDVAENPGDEDHIVFWLVLADQFHRLGLDVPGTFERARNLIRSGEDDRVMAALGMRPADRKKRAKALDILADRLSEPVRSSKRRCLSRPEPLVMTLGEVCVVEVDAQGGCRNPYMKEGRLPFEPAGYTLFAVVAAEHVFGYLAVYAVAVLRGSAPLVQKPDLAMALAVGPWGLELPGTCSVAHARKLRIERLGTVPISHAEVRARMGSLPQHLEHFAIQDVSLANRLRVTPPRPKDAAVASLRELTCPSPNG
jgi:hypothetical protein